MSLPLFWASILALSKKKALLEPFFLSRCPWPLRESLSFLTGVFCLSAPHCAPSYPPTPPPSQERAFYRSIKLATDGGGGRGPRVLSSMALNVAGLTESGRLSFQR